MLRLRWTSQTIGSPAAHALHSTSPMTVPYVAHFAAQQNGYLRTPIHWSDPSHVAFL